ncbi:hypothetical protein R6Q59_023741 [Mikania micrantha]
MKNWKLSGILTSSRHARTTASSVTLREGFQSNRGSTKPRVTRGFLQRMPCYATDFQTGMSGAESSRVASKRRRGPAKRPMGEPDSSVQVQRDERTIRYLDVERVPTTRTRRLRDHTLLCFELGTFESDRIDRFISLELLHHRNISWDLIDQLGQRERLERLLGHKWARVLACDWPSTRN